MSSPMLPRANELPFKAEFVITKHALPSVSLTPTVKADQQRDWWVKSCHLKGFLSEIICFFYWGIQWYISGMKIILENLLIADLIADTDF